VATIKLADRTKTSSREQQMKKWKQHFKAASDCPKPETLYNFEQEEEERATLDV